MEEKRAGQGFTYTVRHSAQGSSALKDLFLCVAVFFLVVIGVLVLTLAVSCYCQSYSGEGCLRGRNVSCTTPQPTDFYFEEVLEADNSTGAKA